MPPSSSPTPPAHDHPALSRAVQAFSSVTLLSRLGGMVREVLLVRIFGETALGSSFAAGFAIPNLFRRLFGEGALSAAFIPEYTAAMKDGAGEAPPTGAGRLASRTIIRLGLVTGALTVLIELALLAALMLLHHPADRAVSIRLVMVMLPFMPLVCCAAILAGMLQVHGKFAASATGPLVLNGFIIAVGLSFLLTGSSGGERTAYVLGAATVLSGVTQCLWFARLLRPYVAWTRSTAAARERSQRMWRRFVPVVIGAGALQISTLLDMLLAMWPIWVGPTMLGVVYSLDERSNIILSAAQRLYQFPLGVFGVAVATAAFPMLSRAAAEDDGGAAFAGMLRRGVRLSLFIALPATAGLWAVAEDLTRVLYSGGSTGFTEAGVTRASAALTLYALGIWAFSLNHVFARAFYARGNTATPMRVSLIVLGANFSLSLGLILGFGLNERALALSSTLCAAAQAVILAILVRARLGVSLTDDQAPVAVLRLLLATLATGAAALGAAWAASRLGAGAGWTGSLVRLAFACAAGAAAYGCACRLLRAPELGWFFARSRR